MVARLARYFVAFCVLASLCPAPGHAQSLDPSRVELGFGGTYSIDGATRTHHGADVRMTSGGSVESPVDGTVRFVGRVPAADGSTVLAVTLDAAQGVVSLMPFDSAAVAKGDTVADGDVLGTVADSGDPSSAGTHVHVGLRRDGLYLDPATLLKVPVPSPETAPDQPASSVVPAAPRDAAAPAPAVQAPSKAGSAAAPQPASQRAGHSAGQAAGQSDTVPSHGTAVTQLGQADQPQASIRTGVAQEAMPQGVTLAPAAAQASAGSAVAPGAQLQPAINASVNTAGVAFTRAVRQARAIGAPAAAAVAGVVIACVMLLTRAGLQRRIEVESPVSDRLGTLLQQLRAGDTLRGLTSCSGHAAFTVPGPFSPEEVTK